MQGLTPPLISYKVKAGILSVALSCAQAATMREEHCKTAGAIDPISDGEPGVNGVSRLG